jgi:protein SCO1/2
MKTVALALSFAAVWTSALAEPVRGIVRAVDPVAGTLTLEREEPKGATVTGFTVSGDLVPERVGTVVAADLKPAGALWRFEQLVPADAEGDRVIAAVAARLRQDTRDRGRSAQREVGDALPELALRDQFGRLFTNADLKGRYVVISFIFTRCRALEMCPASTRKMVELAKKLKAAGVDNVLCLSVSFDPAFDTPGVLKSYADGYGADHATQRFLTGPKGAIGDLQRQFGILSVEDDGTLVHNVATTLVSPAGRILYRADGPRWTVDTFAERITRHRAVR